MTDDEKILWTKTNDYLRRIAVVLERAVPEPIPPKLTPPAGEEAFFRPSLSDLARLEREDRER